MGDDGIEALLKCLIASFFGQMSCSKPEVQVHSEERETVEHVDD